MYIMNFLKLKIKKILVFSLVLTLTQMSNMAFAVADITNPSLFSSVPADDATDVAVNANIVLTFDEAVDVKTGNITIYKTSDDSVVEAIDVTTGQVTGTGTTTITVNPTDPLLNSTEYYVLIDAKIGRAHV